MNKSHKFTILLPVYKNVGFILFLRAFNSIINQTLKADEIIVLVDGPIDRKINKFLTKQKNIKIFKSKKNIGLGKILKIGVNMSHYKIIGRADADDYSMPDRFKTQIDFLKKNREIDILSSNVEEFYNEISIGVRKLPTKHNLIVKMMKFRNPINHSSVFFKKEIINRCGNYLEMKNFEDYFLWIRALKYGAIFSNIDKTLVKMSVDNNFFKRRSGIIYYFNYIKFLISIFKLNFVNIFDLVFLSITRLFLHMLPITFLKKFYRLFLRNN
jgi:glycosyltransferase involved in cell wall biosynthesis